MQFHHADNEDRSDYVDARANLNLRWTHLSEGPFLMLHLISLKHLLDFHQISRNTSLGQVIDLIRFW